MNENRSAHHPLSILWFKSQMSIYHQPIINRRARGLNRRENEDSQNTSLHITPFPAYVFISFYWFRDEPFPHQQAAIIPRIAPQTKKKSSSLYAQKKNHPQQTP